MSFYEKLISIHLYGEHFSYISDVTYDFEPNDIMAPFEDDIQLNRILNYLDMSYLKQMCNKYQELTDEVMTEIYNNCKRK